MLSAARKSDAIMQRNEVRLIDSEAPPGVLMPGSSLYHNSSFGDSQFFRLSISISFSSIAPKGVYNWMGWRDEFERPREILDYHYLSACSFFFGIAEPKLQFINIG